MAAASSDEGIMCSYCSQSLANMSDPRELPCYHKLGMPSLQESNRKSGRIDSKVCGKMHKDICLDSPISCSVDTVDEPGDEYNCFVCEKEETVRYCIKCAQHCCKKHWQKHIDVGHNTVERNMFARNPTIYLQVLCKKHKKEISLTCQTCLMLACVECDTMKDGCSEHGVPGIASHTIVSLETMNKLTLEEFEEKFKVVDQRIDDLRKKEKEVSLKLDKLKDLPFRNEMSIRAETHVSFLKSSKDDLEATRKSADQLLRECHITDIIEKKKEKLQELDEACFRSSSVCEPVPFGNMFRELTIPSSPEPNVGSSDSDSTEDFELSNDLPELFVLSTPAYRSVRLISRHRTQSTCFSVSYRAYGALLVACSNRILLYSRNMRRHHSMPAKCSTSAVDAVDGNIYFIEKPGGIRRCCLREFKRDPKASGFFYFCDPTAEHSRIAINGNILALTEKITGRIIILRTDVRSFQYIEPVYPPSFLCFYRDGGLLVTSSVWDTIMKYRPYQGQWSVEWVLNGLEGAAGVCIDEHGQILVGSRVKKVVYVVAATGTLISRLSHRTLPRRPGGMSIYRDTLAIACEDEMCFKRFRFA